MSQSLAAPLAPVDEYQGATLGPYRVLECIGDGGMGRVYRAEHVELGRPVAIKFLLPYYAADPEAVSRFLQEAKAVNRVRHPNLVDIYDVFIDAERGIRAYVMELLSGRSLRDALMQKPLGLQTALWITRQIASALHAVHGAGIVHRDLKPENIYLCEGAEGGTVVKVLDFGVAKFTRETVPYQTQEGTAVGSPWYMAPEQARAEPVDGRADIYSLGVLLYEMLTGSVPFPGYTFARVIQGHIAETPPPLRRRDGWEPPAEVSATVLRCLAKDAAARPRDMAELWRALSAAAGSRIAPTPTLVPALDPAAARVPGPFPDAPPISDTTILAISRFGKRTSVRRLAATSFALGMAGALAALAIWTTPQSAAKDSTAPASPARHTEPPGRAASPPPATNATPSLAAPATRTIPSAVRATTRRRSGTKGSRWSKAAFDQKRASARRQTAR